jgi:hypothetical protein
VALRGIEAPLLDLRHLDDFDQRHGLSTTAPNRDLFEARMAADRERYGADLVAEIETLYQVADGRHDTLASRTAVETLLRDYPESNRAGCGLLYMAQWESGERKEELLRAAIAEHGDAIYGDGVQVGAYATYQLAGVVEDDEEREALLAGLRERWPDAVDHRGRRLLGSE